MNLKFIKIVFILLLKNLSVNVIKPNNILIHKYYPFNLKSIHYDIYLFIFIKLTVLIIYH